MKAGSMDETARPPKEPGNGAQRNLQTLMPKCCIGEDIVEHIFVFSVLTASPFNLKIVVHRLLNFNGLRLLGVIKFFSCRIHLSGWTAA